MVSRTLAQVRPTLTQVSGMTGMSLTDPRFIARLNEVQEFLANEGDWPGVVDRWAILFNEATGELVLPYWLDRLLQVTVDGAPSQVMSGWAEFINYGAGVQNDAAYTGNGTRNLQPQVWYSDCFDRGEVVSRLPIPPTGGPWKIRVYASTPEADGAVINLQGFYNDELIRTQPDGTAGDWINGEDVAIDFDEPYTETTKYFDKLSASVKPETNGYVRITASDGTSEVELSNYAPAETTPSYRNYFIPSLWRPNTNFCNRVLLARARRRFVPVEEDDDVLIISNTQALKSGIIALWKKDAGDYEAYEKQWGYAVDALRKEAAAYLGKARSPAISMIRGMPIGAMPWIH